MKAALIIGQVAMVLASLWDFRETRRAIRERRAYESGPLLGKMFGTPGQIIKLALTGAFIAASWWTFNSNGEGLAVGIAFFVAGVYAALAVRARGMGRR